MMLFSEMPLPHPVPEVGVLLPVGAENEQRRDARKVTRRSEIWCPSLSPFTAPVLPVILASAERRLPSPTSRFAGTALPRAEDPLC